MSLSSAKVFRVSSAPSQVIINRGLASLWSFKNPFKKSTEIDIPTEDELNLQQFEVETKDLWKDLSDEEIQRICDRSGLDDESKELENRQLFTSRKFDQLREYKRDHVRQFYALYGKDSGLKPGVCWPSREELAFHDKFEKTFYPTLDKLMKDDQEERKSIADSIKEREDDVAAKMLQREKLIAEFHKKRNAKLAEEEEVKKRNEKMVAEVREFLGFNIEKSDPRFQAALAKKEEEERAQAKARVKKDKNSKLAEILHKMLDLPVGELSKPGKPQETEKVSSESTEVPKKKGN